ncbi:hypothetical protein FACS1894177_02440 [Bacteroidia bacterium]|nr:hypothetical protein FACS1894177_02440 [Bacteroidia bacterium]
MKTYIISIILLFIASTGMSGQNIGFSYDADGNMESRYIVTLRSSESAGEENAVVANLPEREIRIYPNPTQGRISINITPVYTKEDNYFRLYKRVDN